MKRRDILKIMAASSAPLGVTISTKSAAKVDTTPSFFQHGVASGDPLADKVILWTRVTPPSDTNKTFSVSWQVATDQAFNNLVDFGLVTAKAASDFTIKIDAHKLEANSRYFYRFECAGQFSPVGTTKTLGLGQLDRTKLAIVSCSNYPAGYFHVYREIAKTQNLDAVIHLGDYLYEYGASGYATERAEELQRVPVPAHEIETLDDYRTRHAQYKTDLDLQSLHANHPMIAVWDDHEFANNAWKGGSQHPGHRTWSERKASALQAYYEWMPIRENPSTGINRRFDFGNLASLTMLDTRLKGREQQVGTKKYLLGLGHNREMLGEWQRDWLKQQLTATSEQRWNLIGQQVMVSPLLLPDLRQVADPDAASVFSKERYKKIIRSSRLGMPLLLDAWDGYPAAREKFLELLSTHCKNPLVLTGDIHTGICSELRRENHSSALGFELITPAVTSPGLDDYFPTKKPRQAGAEFMKKNLHISYVDGTHKGWIELILEPTQMTARWMHVSSVINSDYYVFVGHEMTQQAKL